MSQHFMEVCTFGYTHGQCRCPSKDKSTRIIDCTTPNLHGPIDADVDGRVDFLVELEAAERLEETLHVRLNAIITDRFWYFNDDARNELVEELEDAVKDWLINEAQKIRTDYDTSIQRGGTTEGCSGG